MKTMRKTIEKYLRNSGGDFTYIFSVGLPGGMLMILIHDYINFSVLF